MDIAKVFWSGRSQAIRLPKAFRFESKQARIRRQGSTIILEPIAENWQWLDELMCTLDEDCIQAIREQSTEQERPELDSFFQ